MLQFSTVTERNCTPPGSALIGGEAMTTAVYEEVDGAAVRKCGVAVGLFVYEEFMREVKTPPLFWLGGELVRRIKAGRSPALSDKEVREANSREGLNLIVWEALPCLEFATRADVFHLMIEAFREVHRGFQLKEMITSQAESVERLKWAVDAGGLIWDPAKALYVNSPRKNAEEFVREPHIVGIRVGWSSADLAHGLALCSSMCRHGLASAEANNGCCWRSLPGRAEPMRN